MIDMGYAQALHDTEAIDKLRHHIRALEIQIADMWEFIEKEDLLTEANAHLGFNDESDALIAELNKGEKE